MDPLGPLLSVTRFLSFAQTAILTARERSKLYDISLSWRPLLDSQQNFFLQVFDVPFSTGKPTRPLRAVINIRDTDHDVSQVIGVLPAQEGCTLRVYFAENFDPQELLPITVSPLTESASITSQWSSFSERSHWEIDLCKLSLKPRLRGYLKDSYIDSVSIAAETVRRTMKCVFHSMEDGRVICKYISHG
jgi:hypothetical protein